MKLSRILATLLMALLSTGTGHTQPRTRAPQFELEPIEVKAAGPDVTISSPTTVETRDVVPLRAATSDTASLLRDVPGVSLSVGGGVSSLPIIHGLADDRCRIQVDGLEMVSSCPNHMNPALSAIDPGRVSRVTVHAGVTPVSVGGDSIGGSVVVESAQPEFATTGGTITRGELGSFYRSNGHASGANLSVTASSDRLCVTLAGSTAQSDNYKAASAFKTISATGRPGHLLPLDEVGSTAYEASNESVDLALQSKGHLFELKLAHQFIPFQGFVNQRMDMTENSSDQIRLNYTGTFGWGLLKARAYHEHTRHAMDFGNDKQYLYGSAATFIAPGMPMETEGWTTGAQLKLERSLSDRDLVRAGVEFQRYRLDDWWPPSPPVLPRGFAFGGMAPNTFWNINDGRRDRWGSFAEWEAAWSRLWSSQLGVRSDHVDMDTGPVQGYNDVYAGYIRPARAFNARDRRRTDHNLDLTAIARYSPRAGRTFELGYSRKTRSPNLYERYAWSQNGMALIMNNFVGDGNGYLGNLDLKPEIAHTISATGTWRGESRRWNLKATPYYTHVDDFVDAIRCAGSGTGINTLCGGPTNLAATRKFVVLQYANQSARLYGFDLSGGYPLGRTARWGEFTLLGTASCVNGKNLTTGDGLYNMMPLNGKLTLTQRVGRWDNRLELSVVDGKREVSDVRQEMQTPGFALVHLRSSYSWSRGRVDLGVENLFDRLYVPPLGGAYVGQGSTMSLNGVPWGIPVPGPARSVYAGVTIRI